MAEEEPKPGSFVHIELRAEDMSRLKEFYGEVFDWKFEDIPEMNYTLFQAPNEPHGGIYVYEENMPDVPGGVLNYLLVDSVEETSRSIEQAGGSILVPKKEIPGVGWFSIFKDTEGSVLAIYESKPEEQE